MQPFGGSNCIHAKDPVWRGSSPPSAGMGPCSSAALRPVRYGFRCDSGGGGPQANFVQSVEPPLTDPTIRAVPNSPGALRRCCFAQSERPVLVKIVQSSAITSSVLKATSAARPWSQSDGSSLSGRSIADRRRLVDPYVCTPSRLRCHSRAVVACERTEHHYARWVRMLLQQCLDLRLCPPLCIWPSDRHPGLGRPQQRSRPTRCRNSVGGRAHVDEYMH